MSQDDDWESENFSTNLPAKSVPIGLISNQWVGEDEEEEVKDSWDDPEDEEQTDKKDKEDDESTAKAVQVKKNKKLLAKIEERERKLQEELEKKIEDERELMTPEQIAADKLRQQQLQEEADLEVAKQLLGVTISGDLPVLETKEDFDKFNNEIVRQLGSATKNSNFPGFVDELVQTLCVHLSASELKKIHTLIGNLQIEKHRMEQGNKGTSKKKGKSKPKINISDDPVIYEAYNQYEDYDDFM